MLIESIIKRRGGTYIPFGPADNPEVVYHFAPTVDGGPHVCEVANEAHIERFLSITEGFREIKTEEVKPPPKVEGQPDYDSMDGPALVKAYLERFGKHPGGKMLRDTIIKRLKDPANQEE